MNISRNILFSVLLVAAVSGSSAWAQYGQQGNRDRGGVYDRGVYDRNDRWNNGNQSNNQAFQDGYQRGRFDAEHNHRMKYQYRSWKSAADRSAYESGYNRGYRELSANRGYPGSNGNFGYPGNDRNRPADTWTQTALQFGSQDGVNDGAKDRQTGHSFRPTQGDNYKNATRGYNSSFGSKDQYKQQYRQAYADAYYRGYYGNGVYRNGFFAR